MPDGRVVPPNTPMPAVPHAQDAPHGDWIVLKFGGTSVSQRHRWDTIGKLSRQRAGQTGGRVLIVVSALSGTTDRLTAMVHSNREGQEKLTRAKELATRYAALRKHP